MMLHPKSDEVRKSMFETLCHTVVATGVVISATLLALHGVVDSAAWAGACGTAIAASGAVTIVRRAEVDRGGDGEHIAPIIVDRRIPEHEQ